MAAGVKFVIIAAFLMSAGVIVSKGQAEGVGSTSPADPTRPGSDAILPNEKQEEISTTPARCDRDWIRRLGQELDDIPKSVRSDIEYCIIEELQKENLRRIMEGTAPTEAWTVLQKDRSVELARYALLKPPAAANVTAGLVVEVGGLDLTDVVLDERMGAATVSGNIRMEWMDQRLNWHRLDDPYDKIASFLQKHTSNRFSASVWKPRPKLIAPPKTHQPKMTFELELAVLGDDDDDQASEAIAGAIVSFNDLTSVCRLLPVTTAEAYACQTDLTFHSESDTKTGFKIGFKLQRTDISAPPQVTVLPSDWKLARNFSMAVIGFPRSEQDVFYPGIRMRFNLTRLRACSDSTPWCPYGRVVVGDSPSWLPFVATTLALLAPFTSPDINWSAGTKLVSTILVQLSSLKFQAQSNQQVMSEFLATFMLASVTVDLVAMGLFSALCQSLPRRRVPRPARFVIAVLIRKFKFISNLITGDDWLMIQHVAPADGADGIQSTAPFYTKDWVDLLLAVFILWIGVSTLTYVATLITMTLN